METVKTDNLIGDLQDTYLTAWKLGIEITMSYGLFGAQSTLDVRRARKLSDLTPNMMAIKHKVPHMDAGKAALISLMVGMYNAHEGDELARAIGLPGVGHLIMAMPPGLRPIGGRLIQHYRPWQ